MKLLPALCLFALLSLSRAAGAILLDESFAYTNGPLTIVSGGTWSQHSGATPEQVNVVNEEVNLTFGETEDVNRTLAGQPYGPGGPTNHFYARFTARVTALPTSGGAWFASFKDTSSSGFRCRVFLLTADAADGQFRVGLSTANNNSATVTNTTGLSPNVPFTIVMRLANTNSEARLWVNPSAEDDSSIVTAEAASSFTVAAVALRQNTGMGTLSVDDLVVGTSFSDVISSEPVPPFITSMTPGQTVARGSNFVFIATATGTAPLHYQWLFNGVSVAGATNASYSLTNLALVQQGDYQLVVSNSAGAVTSAPAMLNVSFTLRSATNVSFTLLNYNAHGATIADWSTNSPQVQAIGRQVQFLDPDIITFQEIPMTNSGWTQMTNFVKAFRPGFFLATNSGHDGFIRSVILSRFPITRSAKWLDGISLSPFGYSGFFTRDLFEAEIAVPGWPQHLHVFTTHLKSGQGSDDTLKRAAEARAISNYFANTFLPANPLRPYLLTGDMNEDVTDPPNNGVALPTLTGGTGLELATPVNPFTGSALTFSIRAASLTRRYDYVLPSALLFTNIIGGHVFRTDVLTDPSPALTNDSVIASDHLPVLVRFSNPFAAPFRITGFNVSNETMRLNWSSIPGGRYRIEASSNLTSWNALATNLLATNGTAAFTTNANGSSRYLRVRTEP